MTSSGCSKYYSSKGGRQVKSYKGLQRWPAMKNMGRPLCESWFLGFISDTSNSDAQTRPARPLNSLWISIKVGDETQKSSVSQSRPLMLWHGRSLVRVGQQKHLKHLNLFTPRWLFSLFILLCLTGASRNDTSQFEQNKLDGSAHANVTSSSLAHVLALDRILQRASIGPKVWLNCLKWIEGAEVSEVVC